MNKWEEALTQSLVNRIKQLSHCTCEYPTGVDPNEGKHEFTCIWEENNRIIKWAENWIEFYKESK